MIRYQLLCGTTPDRATPASGAKSASAKPSRRGPLGKPQGTGGCGHEFESWFQNGAAFDTLSKRGEIVCPACGSSSVEKALMAPSVKTTKGKRAETASTENADASSAASASGPGGGRQRPPEKTKSLAVLTPEQRAFIDAMRKVRAHVLSTSEDVGKAFVEEARKIHHEETEARSIHGEASLEEAKALAEEGIDIFAIPVLPDDRN